MSKYGHFSKTGDEYVITDYNTPRPQMNYMWNSRILSGVNHFGGGVGAYGNKAASYIDPEGKGRAIVIRDGNRYFYVRDDQTGEFWNPGWFPAKTVLDEYSCTHGIGYSIIEGAKNQLKCKAQVFINQTEPAELWRVTLTNHSQTPKSFKLYSFVEFSLEGYARYSEYDSYVSAEYLDEYNMVYAQNTAQERPHDWFDGFIASDMKPSGFDTSKKAFLGTYGDIVSPSVVQQGHCKNSLAACELMVGVLEHSISLAANESVDIHIVIGAANSKNTAISIRNKTLAPNSFENELGEVKSVKNEIFSKIFVNTPEPKINNMANYWVKNQVVLCAEAGRSTGKGFRDQLQDSWAIAAFNPKTAKEKILETLRHQYSDGRCVRGWLPLDHHIYSDGPVWIAPTINAYLKETGDFSFLDVEVPYLDQKPATVWDHILLAAHYSSSDLGEHGLTLAHDGDWNDSLNGIGVGGKGESVWTSIGLCLALENTAEMAREIKKSPEIEKQMLELRDKMKRAINEAAWDGQWYLAAYNDVGQKVGSHTEKEGRIYLNSQTWAILAGVCEGDRLQACVDSIDKYLESPYGPLTLSPPYTAYNPSIGRLTGFVPGIWENGTPYCHGGAFKVVTDFHLGRGDRAVRELLKIMPDSQWNPSDHSGCEPYVFTNMYFGPDNPRAGETAFAWVTGTAGWMFRAITQYMLGFHPGYNTITIKPCIPTHWNECSIKRVFRGDIYNISIKTSDTNTTSDLIKVDGKPIEGDTFEIIGDQKEHYIEVFKVQQ